MTAGVEWKQILLFSLPIMLGQLLQQLYNTVDGIVVGNYVGEAALAAVGTCSSLVFLFLAVAMGLGNGAAIMISQFFGARRYQDLREAASTSFLLLGVLGVVFSILGAALAYPLLAGMLNVEAGPLREQAVTYFRLYSIGLMFQFGYNAVAYALRAIGDSKATLYFLLISSVLNLILDLLFVIAFHWGVAGAAIATVLSQLASMIASLIYMHRKYELLRFGRGELKFVPEKCRLCLKLGIPTAAQQAVIALGSLAVQRLINSFGQYTMAACTVGFRLESYCMVSIGGLNMGMSTFTGQNVGAGKLERVRRGLRATLVMEFGITAVISTLMYIFASGLSRLFGVSGEALEQAVMYLRWQALFFPMFSIYFGFMGVIQGSGDVIVASMCSLSSLFVRVIAAYLFAYGLHLGYASCWYCIPVGWVVCLTMAALRYLSGKWKEKAVVKAEG